MKTDTTIKENVASKKKQNVIKQEKWHNSKYLNNFWLRIKLLLSIIVTMTVQL